MIDSAVKEVNNIRSPYQKDNVLWGLVEDCVDLDRHRAEDLTNRIHMAEYRVRAYIDIGRYLATENGRVAEKYFNKAWESCTEIEAGREKVSLMSKLALAWYEINKRSGRLFFEETERVANRLDEPERSIGLRYLSYEWTKRDLEQAFRIEKNIQWPDHDAHGLYFMNLAYRVNDRDQKSAFFLAAIQAYRNMPSGPLKEHRLAQAILSLCPIDAEKSLDCFQNEVIVSDRLRDSILGSAAIEIFDRNHDQALNLAAKIIKPEERVRTYCHLAEKLYEPNRSIGLEILKQAEADAYRVIGEGISSDYPGIRDRDQRLIVSLFDAWSLYSFPKAIVILEKYSHIRIRPDKIIRMVEQWLDRGSIEDAQKAHEQALRNLMMLPPVPRASALKDLAKIWVPVDPDRADKVFHLLTRAW